MLKIKVKQWFFEAIKLDVDCPPELRAILERGHPRLEGFIARMAFELETALNINARKGIMISPNTQQQIVYDMTKYFVLGLKTEAKKRYESDLERLAREAEAQKLKEFDDVLSGNATGEFAEAGVITNEAIDKEREDFLAEKAKANFKKEKSRSQIVSP
jgi:hypothetical protein